MAVARMEQASHSVGSWTASFCLLLPHHLLSSFQGLVLSILARKGNVDPPTPPLSFPTALVVSDLFSPGCLHMGVGLGFSFRLPEPRLCDLDKVAFGLGASVTSIVKIWS